MSKVERKLVLGENKMNKYIRDSRKELLQNGNRLFHVTAAALLIVQISQLGAAYGIRFLP